MNKSALYEKAQNHIRKGHWEKSIELMVQVHVLDDSDPMVTLRLGDLYKKLGADTEAAEYYLKTADLYAGSTDKTKAAAMYKMVLRIAPGLAEAQRKLDALSAVRQPIRPSITPPETAGRQEVLTHTGTSVHPETSAPPDLPERPMEVYYGSSEKHAEADKAETKHETIPGLVELGSTVGRLITDEELMMQGGSGGASGSGIELASGKPDVEIESFAMNKESSRVSPAEPEGPVKGGNAGMAEYELPPQAPATPADAGDDGLFGDFAADVDVPQSARPGAQAGRDIEFLGDLTEDELWELLGRMNRLTFGPGEPIIKEGEAGDSIYIISSGSVMVSSTRNGMRVKLAELHENDFFGEVSFLTGKPRTADVTAMETTTVMELSRHETDGLISKYPRVEKVLRMFQKERVADTIATMKQVSDLW